MSNAIIYTDENKRQKTLTIDVKVQEKDFLIEIEDNGIGIEAEFESKVCQMFFRASEKGQGAGFGMYITKQTLDKLNGKLEIKSRPKHGTKVSVMIPMRPN